MDGYIKIVTDITVYFSLFYPLLYIKGFRSNNKAFKVFTIYLIIIGLIQLATRVYKVILEEPNLHLSHYYFICQFVLLSIFYALLTKHKWIYIVLGLVLAFLGYQYIMDPGMYFRYNPIGMSLTHAIIVIYALLYFYRSLSGKVQFLIVNIGIFFYLLSSTLIFASGNLVLDLNVPESISELLVDTNVFLYLAFQILIFVEWWKNYSAAKINSQ